MKQTIAEQDEKISALTDTIATLVKKDTGRAEAGEEEEDDPPAAAATVTL
jgi:hypothetical protein